MSQFIFNDDLLEEIRSRFYYVTQDCFGRDRIFFENSGGSLRLKAAVEAKAEWEQIGECPERTNDVAKKLQGAKEKGLADLRIIFGGDESGSIVTELTPSQVMFRITRAIIENVPGKNVVTTSLEHPSAYDSAKYYAEKMGMELRVAQANPVTGGVDTEKILELIDKDTCLLSVMSASNISGYIFDLEAIIKGARGIKPDLYIISDAVQHLPHSAMEAGRLGLDGVNYGPYKHFGIRGCGYGYVSERVARLPHDKLSAKADTEWELGTYPHPNFAALSAVVDYVCWIGSQYSEAADRGELYRIGMDKIHAHEFTLLQRLMEGTAERPGLRHMDGVEVYAYSDQTGTRDLIAAIGITGMDHSQAVEEYYRRGITLYERVNKSLYSKRIVESLDLTGAIRVSPFHANTLDEIDEFLNITEAIIASKGR